MYLDIPTLALLLLLSGIIGRLSTPIQRAGLVVLRDMRRARRERRALGRAAQPIKRRRRRAKARVQ